MSGEISYQGLQKVKDFPIPTFERVLSEMGVNGFIENIEGLEYLPGFKELDIEPMGFGDDEFVYGTKQFAVYFGNSGTIGHYFPNDETRTLFEEIHCGDLVLIAQGIVNLEGIPVNIIDEFESDIEGRKQYSDKGILTIQAPKVVPESVSAKLKRNLEFIMKEETSYDDVPF